MTVRIGITGSSGFIGGHLAAKAKYDPRFQFVPFERSFFRSSQSLTDFAASCDAVVHLAGISRDPDPEQMYHVNMTLTEMLVNAALAVKNPPCVFLGSTTHLAKETAYHASKRDSYDMLRKRLPCAVELRMANTFGPGSRPFYNSVVSTFCFLAANGAKPERVDPVTLQLIYVDDLCSAILQTVMEGNESRSVVIGHTDEILLPELWKKLESWRRFTSGLPELKTVFEANLWHTFRSYRT